MTVRPFLFRDAVRLYSPIGVSAATLREFRVALETVEPGVLHHHLRETPLRFTFTFWDYPNDFALWAADALENLSLAERLAALDPFHERDLEVLRERVLDAVEEALGDAGSVLPVPPGQEFHFSSSQAIELDLGAAATNLDEFMALLAKVPATSLFFHLYEARVRNRDGLDDISRWLASNGYESAASSLRDMDIYLSSLESCRRMTLQLLEGTQS